MKFKKLHIVAASILFAIVMWISINMTYDYTTNVSIPVILENFPINKALQKPVPKQLNVRIKGNGWNLSSLKLTGDLKLNIDISELSDYNVLSTDKAIFEKLRLSGEVAILDVDPDSLTIILDTKITKKVMIIPDVVIFFRDGYGQVGEEIISPDSVEITGSKKLLKDILNWKSKRHEFREISESINTSLDLIEPPEYLFKLNQNNINYKIQVQPFAEKTLTGINIDVKLTPINRDVIIIPPKIDLIIRGNIKQLSEITNESLKVFIDYTELLSDTTGYFHPQIQTPGGTKVVQKQPDQFQYIIRKRLQ